MSTREQQTLVQAIISQALRDLRSLLALASIAGLRASALVRAAQGVPR